MLDGCIVMHRIGRPWFSLCPRTRRRLWAAQVFGLSTSVAFVCSLNGSTSSPPMYLCEKCTFYNTHNFNTEFLFKIDVNYIK